MADGSVTVSARIEFDTPGIGLPETLWFRFPERFCSLVSDRADGFVSLLVCLAMRVGEPLEVRGKMSPRLLYGLREYQSAVLCFQPPGYQRVEIRCDHLEPVEQEATQTGVLTPFSGGVDSAYTLWSHLPRNQPLPEFQVSHALYIQGVDVALDDDETMRAIVERHSAMAQRENIELIPAASNMEPFGRYREWIVFRTGLYPAAVTQVLGRGFKRFIATGNLGYNNVFRTSRSPSTDYLFSTEALEVVHQGSGARRYQKIAELAKWEELQSVLRICRGESQHGFENCCRCRKCVATMIRLDALGVLPQFKSFPKPLRRTLIWRLPLLDVGGLRADREAIFRDCRRTGRGDLIFDLRVAHLLNTRPLWTLRRRYRALRSRLRRMMR